MAPHPAEPAPFPAKMSTRLGPRRLVLAASSAASRQDQACRRRFFAHAANSVAPGRRLGTACLSDLVVVVTDADDVADIVVFLFLVFEEGVLVVVAEIDIIIVAKIGQIVATT